MVLVLTGVTLAADIDMLIELEFAVVSATVIALRLDIPAPYALNERSIMVVVVLIATLDGKLAGVGTDVFAEFSAKILAAVTTSSMPDIRAPSAESSCWPAFAC